MTDRCIRSWRAAPLLLLAIPTLLIAAAPRHGVRFEADVLFPTQRGERRPSATTSSTGSGTLVFSTVDDLALWMNGRFNWFVPRAAAAWYDFAPNPKHAGQKIPIDLREGTNEFVLRVRGGAYAAGGFFVRLER